MANLGNTRATGLSEHIARVPLSNEERIEVETIAALERTTKAEVMRRALREYAERARGRR